MTHNPEEMQEETDSDRIERRWSESFRAMLPGTAGDEESLGLLQLAASLGILFLLAYFAVDLAVQSGESVALHLFLIGGASAFLILTWTRMFQRFWKLWVFGVCVFLIVVFIAISSFTHDPVSRMAVVILCPFATASFVGWSPRWQLAMSVVSLALFTTAQVVVPFNDGLNVYRWLSVLAGLALAQSTAIFIDQYRSRIRAQLEALEAATLFREREMATMAHDIRNPVSALAGYVELLEQSTITPEDHDEMIARIGSTAWNTSLVVGNVLDLYRLEESGRLTSNADDVDANLIIAEVADDCVAQARRVRTNLHCELQELPPLHIDPHHLERIVRNLAAVAISSGCQGAVKMRSAVQGDRVTIEVDAPATTMTAEDLQLMTAGPRDNGRRGGAGIGLYLARCMTEAAGGRLTAHASGPSGIHLCVEIPFRREKPADSTGLDVQISQPLGTHPRG